MSYKHLAVAADITGIPPTCKLLLYALSVRANGDGHCPATNAQLQELTGLSERAIRSNLRKLEKLEIIAREPYGYRIVERATA